MGAGPGGTLHRCGIDNRRFGLWRPQPVILGAAADPGRKTVMHTALHQRIAKPATGRPIRHRRMQAEPAKQHETRAHPQRALQLRIAQPMPLPDQQTAEQDQRILALRPGPGASRNALQDRREQPPFHQRINPGQNVILAGPIRRLAQKQSHQTSH